MKRLLLLISLIGVMLLSACGITSDDSKETSNDDSPEEVTNEKQEEEKQEEVSQVIYDDNNIVVTYLGIEMEEDSIFGDSIDVNFDVENNTDRNIEIQAREVSADGRMVDESSFSMSDEVVAGKIGKVNLSIDDYADKGLPVMEEVFEMKLKIFDWDDSDYEVIVPVNIDLK